MTQSISDEAITSATGHPLSYWVEFLDALDGREMPHKQIATLLHDEAGVQSWWSQMLTVAYEHHIGRRVPGQDCDGEFSLSVSRTLHGRSMDDVLAWWIDTVGGAESFSDIPITRGPDTSATENWRYWRAGLADGSAVNVNIHEKATGKISLGIQHEKIESGEQAEHWRSFWKGFLKNASIQRPI